MHAGAGAALATGLGGIPAAARQIQQAENTASGPLLVRFLGTGAADWHGRDERGEMRRLSSILIDGKILIDFTPTDADMVPEGFRPDAIFYTHSHGDHYNPEAALKLGAPVVYLGATWYPRAVRDFAKVSQRLKLPIPEIVPLAVGESVVVSGITLTALPANHATQDAAEQTLMYLIEKQKVRVVYATDTGGIPGDAARMIGIDPHVTPGTKKKPFTDNPYVHAAEPITAFIMEATNGANDDDFRIFVHSSVQTVARIANMLKRTKRLVLPPGQSVMLTHLAVKYRSWPSEKINAELPEGLRAAYDGLELLLG